jgi:hypothetical protein
MKALLFTIALFAAVLPCAAENNVANTPATSTIKGEVLEVIDVESYTYMRLKTKQGESWTAVGKVTIKKGTNVTVENVTMMSNFESKTLKRTFPSIAFGNLAGVAASSAADGAAMAKAHGSLSQAADTKDIKVPKATSANARTVAEVVTQAAKLKDKPVAVRGKVVKYNAGIMGKNWIHLRDGSGTAADNSNDVLVTTLSGAKIGDIVTVNGTVRVDKDFGAGYNYKVLIDEASLQP